MLTDSYVFGDSNGVRVSRRGAPRQQKRRRVQATGPALSVLALGAAIMAFHGAEVGRFGGPAPVSAARWGVTEGTADSSVLAATCILEEDGRRVLYSLGGIRAANNNAALTRFDLGSGEVKLLQPSGAVPAPGIFGGFLGCHGRELLYAGGRFQDSSYSFNLVAYVLDLDTLRYSLVSTLTNFQRHLGNAVTFRHPEDGTYKLVIAFGVVAYSQRNTRESTTPIDVLDWDSKLLEPHRNPTFRGHPDGKPVANSLFRVRMMPAVAVVGSLLIGYAGSNDVDTSDATEIWDDIIAVDLVTFDAWVLAENAQDSTGIHGRFAWGFSQSMDGHRLFMWYGCTELTNTASLAGAVPCATTVTNTDALVVMDLHDPLHPVLTQPALSGAASSALGTVYPTIEVTMSGGFESLLVMGGLADTFIAQDLAFINVTDAANPRFLPEAPWSLASSEDLSDRSLVHAPSGRQFAGIAFSETLDSIVMTGGCEVPVSIARLVCLVPPVVFDISNLGALQSAYRGDTRAFRVATQVWEPASLLPDESLGRYGHCVHTVHIDGHEHILVYGGHIWQPINLFPLSVPKTAGDVRVLNMTSKTWRTFSSGSEPGAPEPRFAPACTLVDGRTLFIYGGAGVEIDVATSLASGDLAVTTVFYPDAFSFDIPTATWSRIGSDTRVNGKLATFLLAGAAMVSGNVLLAGGLTMHLYARDYSDASKRLTEYALNNNNILVAFNPATGATQVLERPESATLWVEAALGSAWIGVGKNLFAFAGFGDNGNSMTGLVWDHETGIFTPFEPQQLPEALTFVAYTQAPNGVIYTFGGIDRRGAVSSQMLRLDLGVVSINVDYLGGDDAACALRSDVPCQSLSFVLNNFFAEKTWGIDVLTAGVRPLLTITSSVLPVEGLRISNPVSIHGSNVLGENAVLQCRLPSYFRYSSGGALFYRFALVNESDTVARLPVGWTIVREDTQRSARIEAVVQASQLYPALASNNMGLSSETHAPLVSRSELFTLSRSKQPLTLSVLGGRSSHSTLPVAPSDLRSGDGFLGIALYSEDDDAYVWWYPHVGGENPVPLEISHEELSAAYGGTGRVAIDVIDSASGSTADWVSISSLTLPSNEGSYCLPETLGVARNTSISGHPCMPWGDLLNSTLGKLAMRSYGFLRQVSDRDIERNTNRCIRFEGNLALVGPMCVLGVSNISSEIEALGAVRLQTSSCLEPGICSCGGASPFAAPRPCSTVDDAFSVSSAADFHCLDIHGDGSLTDSEQIVLQSLTVEGASIPADAPDQITAGAGLYVSGAFIRVKNSNFIKHTAQSGAAMYGDRSIIILEDSLISHNSALRSAGALYAVSSIVTLRDSEIFHNVARIRGGALDLVYSECVVQASTIQSNRVVGIDGLVQVIGGGAVSCSGDRELAVRDSSFVNNSVARTGVASVELGGAVYALLCVPKFDNVSFSQNSAGLGGAVSVGLSSGSSVANSKLSNNTARGEAGAFSCSQCSDVRISSSTFASNVANGGHGGAVLLREPFTTVAVASCTFVGNSATSLGANGGAIAVFSPHRVPAVSVVAGVLHNNSAASGGGGAIFWAAPVPINVQQNESSVNLASPASFGDITASTSFLSANSATYGADIATGAVALQLDNPAGVSTNLHNSSFHIRPAPQLSLVDSYGQVTRSDGDTLVEIIDKSQLLTIAGTRSVKVAGGVATFSDLLLSVRPGSFDMGVSFIADVADLSGLSLAENSTQRRRLESAQVKLRFRSCVAGEYIDRGVLCRLCPQGSSSNSSTAQTSQCEACSRGRFGSDLGAQQCTRCPLGSVSLSVGQDECTPCPAGQAQSADQSQCIACRAGTWSSARAVNCTACSRGTFSPSGASECTPCAPGHSTEEQTGMVSCSGCPPGRAAEKEGAVRCDLCAAGKFQPSERQVACIDCPAGRTSEHTGSRVCTACPPGRSRTADDVGGCVPCGAGSVSPREGSDVCSVCAPGTYASSDRTSCILCPTEGVLCSSGVLSMLPGYWLPAAARQGQIDASTVFHRCEDIDACPVSDDSDNSTQIRCADGHTGVLCAVCLPGFAKNGDHCTRCSTNTAADAAMTALIAAVVVVTFAVMIARRARRTAADFTAQEGVMRIALNWAQANSLLAGFRIVAPPGVPGFLEASSIADGFSLSLHPVQCALGFNYFTQLILYLLVPPLCCLIPVVSTVFVHLAVGRSYKSVPWQQIKMSAVFLCFVTFNVVTRALLNVFERTEAVDGVRYLRIDVSVRTDSDQYAVAAFLAAVGMAVYTFGMPVAAAIALRRNRTRLQEAAFASVMSFTYEGYKLDTYYGWELAVVARKVAVIFISVFVTDKWVQMYLASLVFMLALSAHLIVKPYAFGLLNGFEALSLSSCLVTQMLSLLFWQIPQIGSLLSFIIFVAQLLTLFVIVMAMAPAALMAVNRFVQRMPCIPRRSQRAIDRFSRRFSLLSSSMAQVDLGGGTAVRNPMKRLSRVSLGQVGSWRSGSAEHRNTDQASSRPRTRAERKAQISAASKKGRPSVELRRLARGDQHRASVAGMDYSSDNPMWHRITKEEPER